MGLGDLNSLDDYNIALCLYRCTPKMKMKRDNLLIAILAIGALLLFAQYLAFSFTFTFGQSSYSTLAPGDREIGMVVSPEEMIYCYLDSKNISANKYDVICNKVALPEKDQKELDAMLDNWNREHSK